MGDVVDAAIAAGKINMDAMDDLSSMIKFTLTNASNERKYRSDLMHDMVQSAQNFRQQEIDTFFKGKQLELNGKQLQLDSTYKDEALRIKGLELDIKQQNADTNQKRIDALVEKQEKAKVNKPLFDTLAKEVVDKENKYKQDKTNLDLEIESLESNIYGRKASASGPEIKGMDAFDLFKDKKDPAGRFNKLESLKKSYPKMLDEKQLEIERIRNEMRHISEGGDPGIFYQPRNSASLPSSGSQTFTGNNTSVGGGPGLLPMPGWELSGDKHTDDEKAAQVLRNEEIGRLEGQLPQDIYQAPLSEDTEQKEKDEYDRELLSQAFNPSVPVEIAKKFINELSPKARANVDKVRAQTETTLLLNIGNIRGFDPTIEYDFEKNKAYAALSEDIFRSGGTMDDIVTLQFDSNAKLREFFISASGKVKEVDGVDRKVGIQLETQKMYSEWVLSRNQEKVKAAENQVEAAIKLGVPGLNTSSHIKGLPKSEKDQLQELDSIFADLDTSPESRKNLDKAKNTASQVVDFTNKFISAEQGFNRVAFYNSALDDQKLKGVLAPPDMSEVTGFGYSDEFGRTSEKEDKRRDNERNKIMLTKIKSLTPEQAFKLWSQR